MGPCTRPSSAPVLFFLVFAAPAFAQPPPPPPPPPAPPGAAAQLPEAREGTGLVLGRVTDAASGRGVAGAMVLLSGAGLSPATGGLRILTDGDGQFVFRGLPTGSLMMTVNKGGYLPGAYGRRTPGGPTQSLDLLEGQRIGDVTLVIWKVAAITGTIVDEVGEPLVGIDVRAFRRTFVSGRRGLRQEGSAQTDDRGIYRIFNLSPGQYVVGVPSATAAVPADVMAAYQAGLSSNSPERESLLRDMVSINAPAQPAGSIELGNLLVNPRGRPATPPPSNGRTFAYPTTFYPGASASAQAATITIRSGEERTGIDIQMKPVSAVSVSGIVTGPEGPAPFVPLRLVPSESDAMATELEASSTMSDRTGGFTFVNVTPGQYTLKAVKQPAPVRASRDMTTTMVEVGGGMVFSTVSSSSAADAPVPDGPTLWESTPIAVGRTNVVNVAIGLRNGARVSGRVEFDGTAAVPDAAALRQINIRLEPANGQIPRAGVPLFGRVEPDGRFTTVGLPGGRYLLRVIGGPPSPWTLESAMHDGRDIADVPFDAGGGDLTSVVITFTDSPSELAGTVTAGDGVPDRDAAVLVYPTDNNGWTDWGMNARRMRTLRTNGTGAFSTRGLPAGDYYVVAVPESLATDWTDPATLEMLAREATQVRLEDGQKKVQALRTIRRRS